MKVSAGDKTTPYSMTRETDISTMTSLKEVLAQAKAKESFDETEMSKTIAPKEQMSKANEKAAEKSDDKQDKSADKAADKSNDKSDSKESKDPKDAKDAKDLKDSKDSKDPK